MCVMAIQVFSVFEISCLLGDNFSRDLTSHLGISSQGTETVIPETQSFDYFYHIGSKLAGRILKD